ncbi:MAG: DNA polymerase III subunit delta' [Magnetospirillum sp. WYHS-4]
MTAPEPRANPHLAGHEAAERALLDAFNSGRMAHAWLISGPKGIGKATLAYRFARFVLARGRGVAGPSLFGGAPPAPASLEVPPGDPVCQRVAGGGHADLFTVERRVDEKTGKMKGEIVIDDVRGIGGFMSMTAAEGGWRVAVIDAADDMNTNAANAVLKVLEEPPKGALLLLVCHNPGRLLPTIRSRCRKLVLSPLPTGMVADLLCRYRPETAQAEARELADLAEGSVGRALALAEEGGLELYRRVAGLLAGLPQLDVEALHALGDQVARAGGEGAFATLGDLLRWWMARLALAAARSDTASLPPADRALAERLQAAGTLDRWLENWEKTNRLLARCEDINLDRKQVVLNIFAGLEGAAR